VTAISIAQVENGDTHPLEGCDPLPLLDLVVGNAVNLVENLALVEGGDLERVDVPSP
jgi:hypothetical protein